MAVKKSAKIHPIETSGLLFLLLILFFSLMARGIINISGGMTILKAGALIGIFVAIISGITIGLATSTSETKTGLFAGRIIAVAGGILAGAFLSWLTNNPVKGFLLAASVIATTIFFSTLIILAIHFHWRKKSPTKTFIPVPQ